MISACLIVKNEEKYLHDCLLSIKDIADEIIVVDTGSSDRTVEIAQAFNAKIFYFNWTGDFSAARNYSLANASGEWILYIDADERLSEASVNEIIKLTTVKKNKAFRCNVTSVDEIKKHPSVMSYVRFFPNDKRLKFSGKVHEQIEENLLQNNIEVEDSSIEIIHIGYNISSEEIKKKAQRNLQLLLDDYGQSNSGYNAFQIGQTLGILEQKGKAEEYFLKALEDLNLKKEYRSVAYRYLAVNAADKQEFGRSLDLIEKSLTEDDTQPLSLMAAAKIYYRFNMKDEAASSAIKAYNTNKNFLENKLSSAQNILMDKTELCYHGLEIAITSLNKELFNFFYEKLRSESNTESIDIYNDLYNGIALDEDKISGYVNNIDTQHLDSILKILDSYICNASKLILLEKLSAKFPNSLNVCVQLGKAYLQAGNLSSAESVFEKGIVLEPEEPSFYFYLISVYLQNSKISKIKSAITIMELKFAEASPEIKCKIDSLKNKLAPFIC